MKLSRAEAAKLGVKVPNGKKAQKQDRAARETLIKAMSLAHGLPEPDFEVKFNEWADEPVINPATGKPYQWRFDMVFGGIVAVEQEGGMFGRGEACPNCGRRAVGAHTSVERLLSDMTKYNAASMHGYVLLRFLPSQINSGEAFLVIKKALYEYPPCPP